MKTLDNTNVKDAIKHTSDVVIFGDGDAFELICKASSKSEGWMKSTKAMEIAGVGCLVQVTTQQRNPDGSYAIAEALAMVNGAKIVRKESSSADGDITIARKLAWARRY